MTTFAVVVNRIPTVDRYLQPTAAGEVAAWSEPTLQFLFSVMPDSSFDSFTEVSC